MSAVAPDPGFVARDTLARVTPLGVRFWDPVASRVAAEGLRVEVASKLLRTRRSAWANRLGTFVVGGLPGLLDLELGTHDDLAAAGAAPGDAAYWSIVLGLARRYTVEVRDQLGRFVPFAFDADLPFRGLWMPAGSSPPSSPPGADIAAVPLFSATTRAAVPGFGVVRAQLAEPSGRKASWALLEVALAGAEPVLGLADAAGGVAVFVPYAEPAATGVSPPRGRRRPLAEERWPVTLRCFYDRSCPPDELPDLGRALRQAPAALDLDASPLEPPLELAFGRDLVLRTRGRSEVLVIPAASPP